VTEGGIETRISKISGVLHRSMVTIRELSNFQSVFVPILTYGHARKYSVMAESVTSGASGIDWIYEKSPRRDT